jgi:hypothetical protein
MDRTATFKRLQLIGPGTFDPNFTAETPIYLRHPPIGARLLLAHVAAVRFFGVECGLDRHEYAHIA